MKMDDKRKVIEVLLCSAKTLEAWNIQTTFAVGEAIGCDSHAVSVAGDEWLVVAREFANSYGFHGDICLEAAYRLIESSPVLRREWFGST